MNAVKSGFNKSDLERFIKDKEVLGKVMEVVDDINDYFVFEMLIGLGLTIHHSELTYEKIMMFSFIKDGIKSKKGS